MKTTTKDLRLRTAEILAAADRGERVVISYRGRRRAVLEGVRDEGSRPQRGRNPAFGLWGDRGEDVDEQVRGFRDRRPLP